MSTTDKYYIRASTETRADEGEGRWCARHTVRTPRCTSRVSDILIPPSCIPTASPTISSRRRHHRHRRHARATSFFAIFIRVTRRVNPRAASIFAPFPPPPTQPPSLSRSLHSFVRSVLRIIAFLCRYAISFPSLVEIPPIMSRSHGFD